MRLLGSLTELVKLVFRTTTGNKQVEVQPASQTGAGPVVLTIPDVGDSADTFVMADANQALTTKTIDADQNTITNIDDGNIKAGANIDAAKIGTGVVSNTEFNYLDGVTSAIQTQLNAKEPTITGGASSITSSNLTASKALQSDASGKVEVSTVTSTELGYVSGVTSGIQGQLNNKAAKGANSDITSITGLTTALSTTQGGTGASYANTITLRNGILPSQSGNANKFLKSDGTDTIWASAGGGVGKNYLQDFYDADSAITVQQSVGNVIPSEGTASTRLNPDRFGSSSASADLISQATVNSSQLRGTTNYRIQFTANAQFIETPLFTLDGSDLGKAMSVQMDVTGVSTDNDVQVYAVRYNSSNVLQERIPIAGSASSTTPFSAKLPTGTKTFNGFFIPSSTATDKYAIRVLRNANNTDMRIDALVVGPNQVLQGAIVTDWTEEAITWNQDPGLNTSGGYIAPKIKWRRVGSNMEGLYDFRNGGLTASNSVQVSFRLPQGLTIDTTKYTALPGGTAGVGFARKGATAAEYLFYFPAGAGTPSKSIYISASNTQLAADYVGFGWFSVAISEWQSNTQQAARAVEEYAASTTGTWDAAAAAANTVYGPAGAPISGALTADRTKIVQFQTPIQSTDSLVLEVQEASTSQWVPIATRIPTVAWPSVNFGARFRPISSTQVEVAFWQYATAGTTYNSTTGAGNWSTGQVIAWRVRKISGGAAVGFPIAPANITLIDNSDNYGGNTKLGLMQYIALPSSTPTYNGGISPTVTGTNFTIVRATYVPYQMADGAWRMKFNIMGNLSVASAALSLTVNGTTLKSNINQACAGFHSDGVDTWVKSVANGFSNTISWVVGAARTGVTVSGDVELNSKPTWAY